MIFKILGLLVHPLTAYDKYCLLNRPNLLQHFHMQLSQKRKTFSQLFFTFSEFRFTFERFQKKYDPPSSDIFEVLDSKKGG